MFRSLLSKDDNTIHANKLEDFRQLAIFIHCIKYNQILHSLWIVYLQSGLGKLQSKYDYEKTFNVQVWPISIKSKVKIDIQSGINDHNGYLTFVNNRLTELNKSIQQYQSDLHDHINRLFHDDYSLTPIIQQAIEVFVEDNLSDLRKKIHFKIELIQYYYDERILELQYLQHNPTETQVSLQSHTMCHLYIYIYIYIYHFQIFHILDTIS